jgi:23S rRNA pseudouridine955/2504/2580 synthase
LTRSVSHSKRVATYRDVDHESAGQRLDNFLLSQLKGVPRSHVYRLVRSGQVRVNSGRVVPSYRIKVGDRIRIPPVAMREPAIQTLDSRSLDWLVPRIVYEDKYLMLVDKPAGMAVHGGSGVSLGCVEALRALRPRDTGIELIHRLDRATSGCLLVAKRRSALRSIHALLRQQEVEKKYLALVRGRWPSSLALVDAALTVNRREAKRRVRVDPHGKAACSHFKPIEHFGELATLIEIAIETGRTHQIRVHAAHAGHPIAGDDRYGDAAFDTALKIYGLRRMFLHAHSISFEWHQKAMTFGLCLPLPAELDEVLQLLRKRPSTRS